MFVEIVYVGVAVNAFDSDIIDSYEQHVDV